MLRYPLGGLLVFLALNAAGGGIYGLCGARGIPAVELALGRYGGGGGRGDARR